MDDGTQHRRGARLLLAAIRRVADCPCDEHQQTFLDALTTANELIFKAVSTERVGAVGRAHRVGPDEKIQLANATIPDRGRYLLSFPDLDTARVHGPNSALVGIELKDALQMVKRDAALDGLLVAGRGDTWAAVRRDGLQDLLPDDA